MSETKNEIRARISELQLFKTQIAKDVSGIEFIELEESISIRIGELKRQLATAGDDIFTSVLESHKALCAVKKMGEKDAYGQDPAMYYALAVCGEAGEMGNKIVKGLRNGNNAEASKQAVISELPDIFIYGSVLAHVLDIDIAKLVIEKVDVVTERALSGYYGGPLHLVK